MRDPLDRLRPVLPLGEYRARTPQGQACIDVFGLNSSPVLVKGRVDAYVTAHRSLHPAADALLAGEDEVVALLRAPELREGFLIRV